MLPCSACKEVLDSVVLFAGEQRRRSSPPQLAGSGSSNEDSTLSLVISTDQGGGPEDNYWSVRVDVGGLGVYYLNERTFITKLYSTCAKLQQAPGSEGGEEGGRGRGEKNVMSVYSRKIGEYSTVQKHTIVISENGSLSDVSVQSSVLPRPLDFPPYGLRIWFQLMKHRPEDMKREIEKLLFHMHLLHLTNSSMAMEMTVRDNSAVEPIFFKVPRTRTEYFQDDVYPETRVRWESALTSQQWLNGDNSLQPSLSLRPSDMTPLSEAPKAAPAPKKYQSYNPNFKTDQEKKDELMSAMIEKMGDQDGDPLPQEDMDGCDSDEWSD